MNVGNRSSKTRVPRTSAFWMTAAMAWLVLAIAAAGTARAEISPYLFMGGQALSAVTTLQDEWLDDYTERDSRPGWEGGAGLRIHRSLDTPSAVVAPGIPKWEFRVRLGYGGGSLEDATYSGFVSDFESGERLPFTSDESYEYTNWTVGASFMANVHPRFGFFVGPTVQIAKYKGDRKWTGPENVSSGGDAKDESTVRYGLLEVGAHVRALSLPVVLETYWVPKRFELSTTHILQSDNWQGNFASFEQSVGMRVSYEF